MDSSDAQASTITELQRRLTVLERENSALRAAAARSRGASAASGTAHSAETGVGELEGIDAAEGAFRRSLQLEQGVPRVLSAGLTLTLRQVYGGGGEFVVNGRNQSGEPGSRIDVRPFPNRTCYLELMKFDQSESARSTAYLDIVCGPNRS